MWNVATRLLGIVWKFLMNSEMENRVDVVVVVIYGGHKFHDPVRKKGVRRLRY